MLGKHGVMLPPNMVGLTEEQVTELKLKDEFEDVCVPSGGSVFSEDPVGRRNGKGGRRASVAGCTCCLALGLVHFTECMSAGNNTCKLFQICNFLLSVLYLVGNN